jgi:hypothetical protein
MPFKDVKSGQGRVGYLMQSNQAHMTRVRRLKITGTVVAWCANPGKRLGRALDNKLDGDLMNSLSEPRRYVGQA